MNIIKWLKDNSIILLCYFFVIFFFSYLFFFNPLQQNEKKVEIGQVWVKEYETENPFEEIERDTIKILNIKENYTLYYDYKDDIEYSCKTYLIPINARLIKE